MPATFDFIEDPAPAATQFDFQPDAEQGPNVGERIGKALSTEGLPPPIQRISAPGSWQEPSIEVAPGWVTPPWVPAAKLLGYPKVAEAGEAMSEESAKAISGLTSPLNLGLVAATKAYPPLGVAIAASMVPQIYEGGKQAYRGMTAGDIPEIVRGGTKAAIGTTGAVLGTLPLVAKLLPRTAAEAAKEAPPVTPRESAPVEAPKAPEPQAALEPKPPPLTPTEQAEARADLAAELGEEPQSPVTPEPAPAPQAPPVSTPEAKATEPIKVGDTIEAKSHQVAGLIHEGKVVSVRGNEIGMVNQDNAPVLVLRENVQKVEPEPTPPAKVEAPAEKPLKVGDEINLMGYDQALVDSQTLEGSRYEIFRSASLKNKVALVRVTDVETGETTTLKAYRDYEAAAKDYSDAIKAEGGTVPPRAAPKAAAKPAAEPAPVTASAKVEQQVKTVAKTEGQRSAKEVKSELVSRIEDAVKSAPSNTDFNSITGDPLTDVAKTAPNTVRINIPDDGDFTILNRKENLEAVLARAKRVPTSSTAPSKGPVSREKPDIADQAAQAAAAYGSPEKAYQSVKRQRDLLQSREPTPPAKVEAPEPRKIVAIASRLGDQVEIGNIHLDAENKLRKKLGITENDPRVEDIEHGFIDNQGNFLGREEAWTVAQAAKQVKARTEDPGFLGKEDLKKGTLPKEPKPPETPPTGPGMAVQPTTPEARLSQSLQSVPKQKPSPQGPAAQPMGITPFPGLVTGLQKVAQSAQRVWREIADVPKFAPFKRVINKFHGDTNRTSLKIRQMQADIESRVPDPKRLEAITNWLQADGDVAKLQQWEAATRNPKLKQGYRDAQHLTPYEVQVAKSIRQYYDDLLARGQAYGILDQAKDDYVTQIWKRPLLGGAQFAQFASKLSRTFKFGMKSVFENFFEGEQAGFKPMTKNISKLLGVYVSELEKTIATRDMIRNLTHETASDGNPLAKVEGTAHISEDQTGDPTGPMFVRPGVVKGDVRYAELNHPALKNWKWISKDPESGRDVFILGELRVHPEIRRHLSNALSQSQISKWMREPSESELANILKLAARFGDTASRVIKQTMLGTLSVFHHVQEGTHAVGHRANAFLPEKLGFEETNPKSALFNYALDHGLQVAGDRVALENFREGLGSHGVFEKVPVLGKWIEKHNDLLFNEYIPRLKWDTWQRIYARNLERYKREIAKGEITQDDVAYLSSKQTNAAFGHQNYVDLGRNATVQHVLRLFALAPDFLEARTRFAGQALQGAVSKVGREQLEALGVLGGLFFVGARVLNKLSDDDWHWEEPFKVKYGNRWYGMRSVPEDVWRAFKDTRMFAYNRLNPVFGRPLMELMSGVNYRGEKISASEVFKNALVSGIPIQMREAPAFRNLTETQRNTTISAWEQFLSAMGIQVSRYSPLNQTYKLATKWRKAQGEKEAPTTYPVSKYQPMRYALEDHDLTKATDELIKLTEGGKVPLIKIAQGFRTSLHRPFSGTLANEPKFVASLTADQKALYKEAVAQRSRVWREFVNAEQEYHNRMKQGR